MKSGFLSGMLCLSLISCASVEEITGNQPIIDSQGINMANYDSDLADCQAYADEVQIAQKASSGAVSGAVVGGVLGAIWGNSSTAAKSAGVGAVGGGASGVAQGVRERDRVIKRCLSGRGYRVLN